uniref:F-box domain-containing protein n=1 Tax=Davidia involucrata TaxID=16924 RepID=A0A5B6ZDP7_DAVIN
MSDFIHPDVLIDILTRLPIKTLMQCACVCKSWYSLLTNPSFITAHLDRSTVPDNKSDDDLLLVRSYSEDRNEEQYSVYFDNETFDEYAKLEFPLKSSRKCYFRIVGSCNGLMCLSDDQFGYAETLFLWNPSIRKTLALPSVRVGFKSHGPFMHAIGFGFDPLTNDYKVVRIVYLDCVEIPPEVDIFTLRTGTWRNISHLGLPYLIQERAPQACLNGATHWIASDLEMMRGVSNLIVSFNMSDEVFGEILLPDSMAHDTWLRGVRVAKFQESLSVIQRKVSSGEVSYCIWMMKEYGVADSWTKLFCFDLGGCGEFKRLVGFRKNGGVLWGTSRGYLVSFDREAKLFKDLGIHGSTNSWYEDSFYADAYTESLLLLGVKLCDSVTCEGSSPVLQGEESGSKKSKGKAKKKGENMQDTG